MPPKERPDPEGSAAKGKKRMASDDGPDAKKPRADSKLGVEHNSDGDPFIAIDKMRRVTVRKFKGKMLVDLREFYTDKASGDAKPGKKGISLSAEQWAALKANMDVIDEMLSEAEK